MFPPALNLKINKEQTSLPAAPPLFYLHGSQPEQEAEWCDTHSFYSAFIIPLRNAKTNLNFAMKNSSIEKCSYRTWLGKPAMQNRHSH